MLNPPTWRFAGGFPKLTLGTLPAIAHLSEKPNMKTTIQMTKQAAFDRIIDTGFDAILTPTGVDVFGMGWFAHYNDKGQDVNRFRGQVPSQLEELAVWDDETARAI